MMACLRLRLGSLPLLWTLFFAFGAISPLAIAYDERIPTTSVVYDCGFESAIAYDAIGGLATGETKNWTTRDRVLFAETAGFVAAEGGTTRLLTEAEKSLYGRVTHPRGFPDQVWEGAKAADGNVYDPTGRILKFDEPWELGHTPANKFSDAQLRAAQEGWDRQTWIRYQNDPAIYRPELPSSNASHKWE